jgi:hypothetical protein
LKKFDLDHIFLVFSPGSAGNFIAGLLHRLKNNEFDSLPISNSGSSHSLVKNKINNIDYLSFGTLPDDRLNFTSDEDRIQFYLNGIQKSDIPSAQVTWTHDHSNIPLYRKYFKNSKIIVITHDTIDEKLAVLFMNTTKTLLDQNAVIPLTKEFWNLVLYRWRIICIRELSNFVKNPEEVFNNKQDNINIIKFATIRALLKFYGMLGTVDTISYKEKNIFDHVLIPVNDPLRPYNIINSHDYYIDDDCIKLPYSCLMNSDLSLFIKKLSLALGFELNNEQEAYVKKEFENYISCQDQKILVCPKQYYFDLKQASQHELAL